MRPGVILTIWYILFTAFVYGQTPVFDEKYKSTAIAALRVNDSLIVYQCHLEQAVQTTVTDKGQVLEGQKKNYSISEKYVITRSGTGYRLRYYTSALTVFPNRKFSGLKKKERKYWEFKPERIADLSEHDVLVFAAAEKLGKETTEYDFTISKYTTNQVIFKGRSLMRQLVLETPLTIRQSLQCFK